MTSLATTGKRAPTWALGLVRMDLMLRLQEAHHFIRTTMRKPTEQDGWL
jgi:hypothetical protein